MAISAETDLPQAGDTSWLVRYSQEHVAHLLVILGLVVYPAFHFLVTLTEPATVLGYRVGPSPLAAEAVMALPRVSTMIVVFYFGLFAMSFDFISGYTGYLSFGHTVFYGTGAYVVLLAANGKIPLVGSGTPFMVLLVVAGLVAAALALLIGVVSFRLTGVYFAMITLGFAQVAFVFVRGWGYVGENPRDGVFVNDPSRTFDIGVPWVDQLNLAVGRLAGDTLSIGGITFDPTGTTYYLVGTLVLVCYFAMQRIVHSPFGSVMIAIRENEERARAVGYDTFKFKLAAFAISGFFAAIAGGLLAGVQRQASPGGAFHFLVTGDALLAAVIGGFGTLAGPLYGRLFDVGVREFLSKEGGLLPYLRTNLPESVMTTDLYHGFTVQEGIATFLNGHGALYVGLLFVVFVLYVPNGLLGTVRARLGAPVAAWLAERIRTVRRDEKRGE